MKKSEDRSKIWQKKKLPKVVSSKVQLSKRWLVVYDHDGSPVDGAIFMHKNKADDFRMEKKDPSKYRVEQAAIMPNHMCEEFLFGATRC
jgi:hypothetical protein